MQHPPTAASAVADRIRQEILEGQHAPDSRLDEVTLGAAHGVSRNTLREAFRLLAHDRLVEHRPHRGVFVRTIGPDEARDIYAVRRMVSVGALRDAAVHRRAPIANAVAAMERAVTAAEAAREVDDWATVGSMNGEFHVAITSVAGNHVADRVLKTLMAEVRLVFLTAGTPFQVHDRYLDENRRILELVRGGDLYTAATALESYLLDAERHLIEG